MILGALEFVHGEGLFEECCGEAFDLDINLSTLNGKITGEFLAYVVTLALLGFNFGDHPICHFGVEAHASNMLGHLLGDPLLPDIWVGAISFHPLGASQVVMAFLQFGGDEAAAFAATEDAAIEKWFEFGSLGLALLLHRCLGRIEDGFGDQGLMLAFVVFSLVAYEAVVERIAEQAMILIAGERIAISIGEAERVDRLHEPFGGVLAGGIELESFADKRCAMGIKDDGPSGLVVEVAERRKLWPDSMLQLLPLAAANILRKIIAVVLGVPEHDAEHELARR